MKSVAAAAGDVHGNLAAVRSALPVAVVAMDIHKKFSKAVVMDADCEILLEERVSHRDKRELAEFFSRFEPGTDVVMEATFNWPWIADLAEAAGLSPHIAHAPRLREMAKGLPKSDRRDAIFIGTIWLSGKIFPESYLAPPEVRRMRGLFRTRILFVRMRTALKNNIHGQFHKLGVMIEGASDIFSIKGRGILKGLDLDDDSSTELARKLAVLDDLDVHIAKLERAIKVELVADERAEPLMTLPGVGELTAYAILAEMGELDRFPNGRALAAYAGLLPLDNKSADKDFGKRTSKACNHFLRWVMIEAVSGAVKKSPRMRSLHSRVKARNRKKAGKARVAVAREVLELAHLLLTRKVSYLETPPPRPGSKEAAAKSERRAKSFRLTGRRLDRGIARGSAKKSHRGK